jgi:phenylacetate-CoA ligase
MSNIQNFETMSRDDLAQLQIERLQTTLNRVYRNVAFYRHALDERKIEIEKVRTLEDIRELPFTTREDLRSSYPYGMFALPLRDIVRIHATSGTTGRPIVVGYSKNDIHHWSDLVARELSWAGVTEHDVVQIGFTYGLFTGGFGFHFGAEKIGASVIPASTQGNLRDQLTIMKDFKTSTLICSPSTALSLARILKSMDIHPEQMHLKRGIFGSEPWSETVRSEIEGAFHITAYDSYGMSEIMGPGVAGECAKRNGLHVNEDHFIVEVIDPRTNSPVLPGDEGELVFTTITKEAFPVIRYRTGDRACLMEGVCECGRTFVRMSRVKGRTDDMVVIQGVKLFPSQVHEALLGVAGIAPLCMIVLDKKDNADSIEVRVAVDSGSEFIDEIKTIENLRSTVCRRLQNSLGIAAAVTFMEEGSLQNETRGKKQPLVIDKR